MDAFEQLINFSSIDIKEFTQCRLDFIAQFPTDYREIATTAFESLVPSEAKTNLLAISNTLAYSGFDPIEILKLFLDKSKEDETEGHFEVFDNNKTLIWKISKSGNVKQDLLLIVLIFATRGTKLSKIKKKIDKQWVDIIAYKCKSYGIEDTVNPNDLSRTTITVARLAACLPHWVCWLHHMKVAKSYVDISSFNNILKFRIPNAFLCNSTPSIIPKNKGETTEMLLHYAYLFSFFTDRVINKKKYNTEKFSIIIDDIKKYVDAAHNSNFMPENTREMLMKVFGVADDNGFLPGFIRSLTAISEIWKNIELSTTIDMATTSYLRKIEFMKEDLVDVAPGSVVEELPLGASASTTKTADFVSAKSFVDDGATESPKSPKPSTSTKRSDTEPTLTPMSKLIKPRITPLEPKKFRDITSAADAKGYFSVNHSNKTVRVSPGLIVAIGDLKIIMEGHTDTKNEEVCTPLDVVKEADIRPLALLPEKSRKKYKVVHNEFMNWRGIYIVILFSESVLLAYFGELSTKYVFNFFDTIIINNNLSIEKYSK